MAEVKHRCRLYFQLPTQISAKLETQLAHAIANTDAACVLLGADGGAIEETRAGRAIDLVQSRGLACLLADNIACAERLGVDGVHIAADPALYAEARRTLGESANIGAGCGLNRHDAMLLAERGADYVAFGVVNPDIDAINQCADLIAWWAEIFVVPSIAWNVGNAEDAARFAAIGADFIALPAAIWSAEDASQRIVEIDRAVRQARRAA